MIYLLDSTKVPFIISHAHHAHVLLFLLYTVLSQSVLLGLRFTHNSVFSLPPTLCSDWNLCLALSTSTYVTIYLAQFYSSTLGLTPSLGSRDVERLSCFPIKGVTGKCRPRPWYNTSRLINRIITEQKSPTFALTWFPAFASIRKTPNQITS